MAEKPKSLLYFYRKYLRLCDEWRRPVLSCTSSNWGQSTLIPEHGDKNPVDKGYGNIVVKAER